MDVKLMSDRVWHSTGSASVINLVLELNVWLVGSFTSKLCLLRNEDSHGVGLREFV